MSVPQFGWVGFHEEERAFEDVMRRQDPERPVFHPYEDMVAKYAAEQPLSVVKQAVAADMAIRIGFDSGFFFWPTTDKYFPTLRPGPQGPGNISVGSCVAYSDVLSAVDQMCHEFFWLDEIDAPFVPLVSYSYGAGRVYHGNNQLGRRDGSTGAWQIAADHEDGYLPRLTPNLPGPVNQIELAEPDNPEYVKWGYTKSILDRWRPIAMKHRLGTSARLQNLDEVRQALLEPPHRAITIASSQGFADAGFDARLGLRLHRPRGSWAHQLYLRGCGTIKGQELLYVGNQWGLNFHGDPGIGPRGGFWLPMEDAYHWVKRAVVYARGEFEGQEQQRPNFGVI